MPCTPVYAKVAGAKISHGFTLSAANNKDPQYYPSVPKDFY